MDKRIVVGCWMFLVTLIFTAFSAHSAYPSITGCSPSTTNESSSVGALSGCNSTPPAPVVNPTASASLNCNPSQRPDANCTFSHWIQGYWLNPNNLTWTFMWSDNSAVLLTNELCGSPGQPTNCTHGPFSIVYYGSWQVKHYWTASSGDVQYRSSEISSPASLSCP